MAIEKSFVMFKPGVYERGIMGELISRFERKGFRFCALKLFQMTQEKAEEHYQEHRDKPFFPDLIMYMKDSIVFLSIVQGESAISLVRLICGATRPSEALPGTVRGDYALNTTENIIHASDSLASARREIALFFPEEGY